MGSVLSIAANVSTALACLSFFAVIGYFIYSRKLSYEEKKLQALPPKERATHTDEYLTRYGINGKGLPVADQFALIKDELEKRHRRSNYQFSVAAAVFLACFAIAVLSGPFGRSRTTGADTNAVSDSSGPGSKVNGKTVYRVIDARTKDPIYHPELELRYSVAGTQEERILKPAAREEQFDLPIDVAEVKTLNIICPAYRPFHARRREDFAQTTVALTRRPPDDEVSFADAIAPRQSVDLFTNLVAPEEYKLQVQDQVVGQPVSLHCKNESPYALNLVVYKWVPTESSYRLPAVSEPQFPQTWSGLEPTCEPEKTETYTIHTFDQRGVYYFVAGSICAQEATILWHGNLHRTNPPTIEVSLDPGSKPGRPVLSVNFRN